MSGLMTLSQNEFLGNLTNLIIMTKVNNTVSDSVHELVASCFSEQISYGASKGIITVDTLAVEDYSATSSLLTATAPTVDEQQLNTTDTKFIAVTINKYLMAGAFSAEYSLEETLSVILSMLEKTKNIYLFKKCVAAFEGWTGGIANDGTTPIPAQASQTLSVELIDTSAITDATELESANIINAKRINKALMDLLDNMTAPSRDYNELEFEQMPNKEDLKLIINSKWRNDLIVDNMATLLNSSKIADEQKWGKVISIPSKQFTSADNIVGWLVHNEKYQISPRFSVATSFFDASNLNLNNWLHFWLISGFANGLPAVKIVATYPDPADPAE